MTDKQADREAIRLLAKVDKLEAELRALRPQLTKACQAYGRRRGYLYGFREYHMRAQIEREQNLETAA